MSHGGFTFEQDPSVPKPGWGAKLVGFAYGQTVAIVLGFALLMLLTNATGAEFFKGDVRELYDAWVQYLRPAVGVPLQWLVDHLPQSYRFIVPAAVADYLLVGFSFLLWESRRGFPPLRFFGAILVMLLMWPLILFVFWPTSQLIMGTKRGNVDVTWTQWLPPLVYGAAWFAAALV